MYPYLGPCICKLCSFLSDQLAMGPLGPWKIKPIFPSYLYPCMLWLFLLFLSFSGGWQTSLQVWCILLPEKSRTQKKVFTFCWKWRKPQGKRKKRNFSWGNRSINWSMEPFPYVTELNLTPPSPALLNNAERLITMYGWFAVLSFCMKFSPKRSIKLKFEDD